MSDHEDRLTVYEIGYLISGSIPEDHVPAEADKVKDIVSKAGANIISEEMPHLENLAYTIRKKTGSGAYEKYDQAYFGWVKFELGSSKIDAVKKAVELVPSVIRMLLTTTIRENTFLGKRAPAMVTKMGAATEEKAAPIAPPASIEDMDKSIDEMVKEA